MTFVSLGEIATLSRSSIKPDEIPTGTIYVGLEHITEEGGFVGVNTVANGQLASNKFRFDERHILYGKLRPYLRKIARPSFNGICSTDILPILPGPHVDRNYLYHFLRTPAMVELATSRSAGANLPRLSPGQLASFEIPLPPLPDQRRIAAILDAADALRAKRRAALAKLDALGRAAFLEMFGEPVGNTKGYEDAKLADLADIVSGVTKGQRFNGKPTVFVPYMRVANVQDGHIVLTEVKTIEALESDVEKYQLQVGDILLTEGGDPDKLGRGAIWQGEIENCIHQNHIFRVRLTSDRVIPEYVSALISSQRGKRYFLKAAKQTTGIATINKSQLGGFPVLLPPIEQQVQYRQAIEALERLKGYYGVAMQRVEELFGSLQQRAFCGELFPLDNEYDW